MMVRKSMAVHARLFIWLVHAPFRPAGPCVLTEVRAWWCAHAWQCMHTYLFGWCTHLWGQQAHACSL